MDKLIVSSVLPIRASGVPQAGDDEAAYFREVQRQARRASACSEYSVLIDVFGGLKGNLQHLERETHSYSNGTFKNNKGKQTKIEPQDLWDLSYYTWDVTDRHLAEIEERKIPPACKSQLTDLIRSVAGLALKLGIRSVRADIDRLKTLLQQEGGRNVSKAQLQGDEEKLRPRIGHLQIRTLICAPACEQYTKDVERLVKDLRAVEAEIKKLP